MSEVLINPSTMEAGSILTNADVLRSLLSILHTDVSLFHKTTPIILSLYGDRNSSRLT